LRGREEESLAHEAFAAHHHADPPSNRSFGLTVGGLLLVVALWPYLRRGLAMDAVPLIRWWLVVPGGILLFFGAAYPKVLGLPNRIWMRLALLLAKVTNPIFTALLFFLFVTPMGLVLRAMGKDAMNRRFDSKATTYWIPRDTNDGRGDMRNQF
jgi:cytochrome c oxidase subunit IV